MTKAKESSTEKDQASRSTRRFKAEIQQVLDIVVHSLYSNREIFLRELVSNASDALEKLRFEALRDDSLYEGDPKLQIQLAFDRSQRTISISDNGIGMTRQEVIENLGTIAGSGTRRLLESLRKGDDGANLIGKFGVGFYSAFIVAKQVEVLSRRAGALRSEGVRWISAGKADYSIESVDCPRRGTRVTLHLREDADQFLSGAYLREIIHKYSEHIAFPIEMDAEDSSPAEAAAKGGRETVNQATALWTRQRKDISEQEYHEFYHHFSHDPEAPLTYIHSKVEGTAEYICLLYLPARMSGLPWEQQGRERGRHGIRLYVRRVFILDGAEQFLPSWLRFVCGVVDADDLPLNLSREVLQENRLVSTIRSGCTRKVLDRLRDLAKRKPEDYRRFWQEFGSVLREGLAEPSAFRDDLIELLRFASTAVPAEDRISLRDYVQRMSADQEEIYCLVANTLHSARNSPHLEIFREREIEVLLLGDTVDEWLLGQIPEYDGKKLRMISKGELQLPGMEPAQEADELIKQVREHLGARVSSVRFSRRLRDSASCIVYDEQQVSDALRRVLRAAGQELPENPPILELNPEHFLLQRMREVTDPELLCDWSQVLLDQALLVEGSPLPDPAAFIQRLNRLLAAPPAGS